MYPPPEIPQSRSDRLRVGVHIVDVATREVHAPGMRRPRRITPKSMAVLLSLAGNPGRVVSRDALLASVWAGTMPTNDVVTQAVTQLRKAFAEPVGNPPYIETIAKTGYRLLADVEWLQGPGAPQPEVTSARSGTAPAALVQPGPAPGPAAAHEALPARPRWSPRVRAGWVVAGLAAVVLLSAVAWWQRPVGPAGPAKGTVVVSAVAPSVPTSDIITSSPGFELLPSLSPDGSMVAYMAVPPDQRNIAIMVQSTYPTTPQQLTRPPGSAEDVRPQWSPDGREIAFLRLVSASSCRVMVISATGGNERTVSACDKDNLPSFDWTPDGDGLVFSSRGGRDSGAGLRVLDFKSGALAPIEYGARAEDVDFLPRYSPDGRWIVFVRNSPVGDFWRIPAGGGAAERLSRMGAEIRGWDWSPTGDALIYARRNESESRLYRLELGSGASTDLGLVNAEDPAVAASAPLLAFVRRRTFFGIYRIDLSAPDGAAAQGERLFASSGTDRLPAIAPDGRQLVFASDRSGEFALWWADVAKPASLRLIGGLRPESRHLPAWSADSRRVLVAGTDMDGRAGIFEVLPASGRVSRLAIPLASPVHASYVGSADAEGGERLLVVGDSGGGRLGLTLFDRSTQPWRVLATLDDVALAQVDPIGRRVLLTRPGAPGLWEVDPSLSTGSLRRIDAEWPVTGLYRAWTVAADGAIYSTGRLASCPARLYRDRHRSASGEPRCLDRSRRVATTGFSVDARAERAYVTLAEWDGADIALVPLANVPPVPPRTDAN